MSICTSSGEPSSTNVLNAAMRSSSLGLPSRFFALAVRNACHAVARHRSGIPFHVLSMSFGFLVSNSKFMPPPCLSFLTTFAIFRHFSSLSHSRLLISCATSESSSSSAMSANPGGSVSMSPASSTHFRSLLCGSRLAAERILDSLPLIVR